MAMMMMMMMTVMMTMSDDSDDEMTDDSDGNEKGGCSQSILALETLTLVRCHFHQSSHNLIIWTNPKIIIHADDDGKDNNHDHDDHDDDNVDHNHNVGCSENFK